MKPSCALFTAVSLQCLASAIRTRPPRSGVKPLGTACVPRFPWLLWLVLALMAPSAGAAGFTSLYAFGDGVSTTTNNVNPSVAYLYYGNRFCNGRVWVEVLAQRQGITYSASKNWSYFGHYGSNLVANLDRFTAPDASASLFVVWVADADFVYALNNIDPPYSTNADLAPFTAIINQSLSNHTVAIQKLYAKGARTLVMPNAVDLTKAPYYQNLAAADRRFVRERVVQFNIGFSNRLNSARVSMPQIRIVAPDFFALFDDIHARPTDYGLVNPGVDAVDDPALVDKSLNGPGAQYVFWDYLDPTAKAQMIMANVTQQLISPVRLGGITAVQGGNRLDIVDVPVGRNGTVQMSGDFAAWTTGPSVSSTNVAVSVVVPSNGPYQFYRLRFPFSWTWP